MAWEPMETAPTDRQILVRRHNDVAYEYYVVWWGGADGDPAYPWTSDYTAYPAERLADWHEIPGNAPQPVNESNASTAPGMQRGNCRHDKPLKDHCDQCADDFRNAN